jgi:hypothetical protein
MGTQNDSVFQPVLLEGHLILELVPEEVKFRSLLKSYIISMPLLSAQKPGANQGCQRMSIKNVFA